MDWEAYAAELEQVVASMSIQLARSDFQLQVAQADVRKLTLAMAEMEAPEDDS